MYDQPNKTNVTYIKDLPDLEDLESHGGMHGSMQYGPPGMNNQQNMMGIGEHVPFQHRGPPGGIPAKFQKFIRTPMGSPPPESGMSPYHAPSPQQEFFTPPQQDETPMRPAADSPSCLTIADHVGNCPICSKFYKNDTTVYIIAIVILAIICILLLKRVLNL